MEGGHHTAGSLVVGVGFNARREQIWIEISLGNERMLSGDGRAMRVLGVGSVNLRMHSKN